MIYFNAVITFWNAASIPPSRAVNAPSKATATTAAIKAYSIIVTPFWAYVLRKKLTSFYLMSESLQLLGIVKKLKYLEKTLHFGNKIPQLIPV